LKQVMEVRPLPPECCGGFRLVWRKWQTHGVERAGASVPEWGFESPHQHHTREWRKWLTHRPQTAVLEGSNPSSRIFS
jgi:hypothetical protein